MHTPKEIEEAIDKNAITKEIRARLRTAFWSSLAISWAIWNWEGILRIIYPQTGYGLDQRLTDAKALYSGHADPKLHWYPIGTTLIVVGILPFALNLLDWLREIALRIKRNIVEGEERKFITTKVVLDRMKATVAEKEQALSLAISEHSAQDLMNRRTIEVINSQNEEEKSKRNAQISLLRKAIANHLRTQHPDAEKMLLDLVIRRKISLSMDDRDIANILFTLGLVRRLSDVEIELVQDGQIVANYLSQTN